MSSERILKKKEDNTYEQFYPITSIESVVDSNNQSLRDILNQFNHRFILYTGSTYSTRSTIPNNIRRTGLLITYVKPDNIVVSEIYLGTIYDNSEWCKDDNWVKAAEKLTSKLTLSELGTWVIDDVDTGISSTGPKGDKGDKGDLGLSIYELLVDSGRFLGTELLFINDFVAKINSAELAALMAYECAAQANNSLENAALLAANKVFEDSSNIILLTTELARASFNSAEQANSYLQLIYNKIDEVGDTDVALSALDTKVDLQNESLLRKINNLKLYVSVEETLEADLIISNDLGEDILTVDNGNIVTNRFNSLLVIEVLLDYINRRDGIIIDTVLAEWEEGYYEGATFDELESDLFNRITIDVSEYNKIDIKFYCLPGYSAKSAFVDENNNVLLYIYSSVALFQTYIKPANAKYLKISHRIGTDNQGGFSTPVIKLYKINPIKFATLSDLSEYPKLVDDLQYDFSVVDLYLRLIFGVKNGRITTSTFDSNHIQSSILSATTGTKEFCHFSIDDIIYAINDLKTSEAESLWDIEFFAWLKSLHISYGATISLYCQNTDSLDLVKDTWKTEFKQASSWLKFGFHNNSTGEYNATAQQAKSHWDEFVLQVLRFTGTLNCVDRCPRLDYYHGSKEALEAMRDCDCGAVGFLAADDNRDSYFLTRELNDYLISGKDSLVDSSTSLTFFRTDYRFDWLKSDWLSSNSPGWTPTDSDVENDLNVMYNTPKYKDTFRNFIMFCHEIAVYNNATARLWVEQGCKWCYDNNLIWMFPQEKTPVIMKVI